MQTIPSEEALRLENEDDEWPVFSMFEQKINLFAAAALPSTSPPHSPPPFDDEEEG